MYVCFTREAFVKLLKSKYNIFLRAAREKISLNQDKWACVYYCFRITIGGTLLQHHTLYEHSRVRGKTNNWFVHIFGEARKKLIFVHLFHLRWRRRPYTWGVQNGVRTGPVFDFCARVAHAYTHSSSRA